MGQLSFERELFADTTSVRERTWDWLTTRYRTVDGKPTGVSDAVRPFFDRIFDQFGDSEAVERCKCLDVLENPYCQLHGWKPIYSHASYYLGLFDHTIKYHVCWARAAAARAGATPDVAVGVFEQTDYREGRAKFANLIGHVVFDEEKERGEMRSWSELTSLPVQQVNKMARGKTCGECESFEPCPNPTCHWGICRAELDRWDGGNLDAFVCDGSEADDCEDWEEA